MTEAKVRSEEDKPKFDKKALLGDALYYGIKGLGTAGLNLLGNLKVDGADNIPIRGKAILTTISKNVFRDMLIFSQLTGRKIHFMLHPKIMANQMAGPLLKSIGMIRGTRDKDDTEPIDKVFEILNQKGELVAMTPEAKYDHEIQVKSIAGIIKFAIAGKAPIIPILIYTEKSKLLNLIPLSALRVKVGKPLAIDKKLSREKYRDQRYELAEDIIKIIESLRPIRQPEDSELKT